MFDVVKFVCIYDEIEWFDYCYDMLFGDMQKFLLVGQMQWLLIVWVLYCELCLLIFDEFLLNFDQMIMYEICCNVLMLLCMIVFVMYDVLILLMVDWIYWMYDGVLIDVIDVIDVWCVNEEVW